MSDDTEPENYDSVRIKLQTSATADTITKPQKTTGNERPFT